jgi:xanthine dehydrogenase accessory factor
MEDGDLIGTIGGGLLEHRVLEKAKEVFRRGESRLCPVHLSGKDVAASDMICGGNVEVYLDPLFAENRETVQLFGSIVETIESGGHGVLLTKISNGISALDTKVRMLMGDGSVIRGEIEGLGDKTQSLRRFTRPRLVEFPDLETRVFLEPVEDDPTLLLFGAGHVATFVAPLAKMIGFRVAVIDDRAEFANAERFPDADEIHVLPFAEGAQLAATAGSSSYVTIMTRGHIHDRIVLEAALETEPAYVGMIGSRKKWALIDQALREKGISVQKIEKVHSPIGIDIGGETPEEIAVSIVAELIKSRAAKAGMSE